MLSNIAFIEDHVDASQEAQFIIHARKKIAELFNHIVFLQSLILFLTFHICKYILISILECLAGDGPEQNEHSKLTGYIMAYLAILTGHRSIVLTNMTRENVAQCEAWDNGKKFQILVSFL